MTSTEIHVVDQPERSRFIVERDGHVAHLDYRAPEGRLIIVHTEVPEQLEGHGIAGQLVIAALDRARREGLTVVPWCPYARSWLERHPDVAATLTIDWTPPS